MTAGLRTPNLKFMESVGIIGAGKIGRAIALGLRANNTATELKIICSDHQATTLSELQKEKGIRCTESNAEVVEASSVIVLCVKPYQAKSVLSELRNHLKSHHLLISVCASITFDQLNEWSGGQARLMRAMPNLPVVVNHGVSVLCSGSRSTSADSKRALKIFSTVGHVLELEEKHLDSVTALSGSGPAFMFFFIEALSEAGARLGIPKEKAYELVFHTMRGSAELCLEKTMDPGELIQQVATPGGCTLEGLKVFDQMNVRKILIQTIEATAKRASQLRLEA